MSKSSMKDTPEILDLILRAQKGDSRAENELIIVYAGYVEYMVSKYSKKTQIKEDDDLRSYIYLGLMEGIRRFDPKKGAKFIYFAHIWMKKNIFLKEGLYRFIRVPANQKIFHSGFKYKDANLDDDDIDYEDIGDDIEKDDLLRFLMIENTKTNFFTDYFNTNSDLDEYEHSENIFSHLSIENFKEEEEEDSKEVLKENINKILKDLNTKEKYIIEHTFGLNNKKLLSTEQIAKKLGVTSVNINFTRTKIIRLLRHSSYSDILLKGI